MEAIRARIERCARVEALGEIRQSLKSCKEDRLEEDRRRMHGLVDSPVAAMEEALCASPIVGAVQEV